MLVIDQTLRSWNAMWDDIVSMATAILRSAKLDLPVTLDNNQVPYLEVEDENPIADIRWRITFPLGAISAIVGVDHEIDTLEGVLVVHQLLDGEPIPSSVVDLHDFLASLTEEIDEDDEED